MNDYGPHLVARKFTAEWPVADPISAAVCDHPIERRVTWPSGGPWCGICRIRIDDPNPEPETSPADRDDDRLATELFRGYGSVEKGLFRGREHWVADADAVRQLITAEQLVRVSVHSGPDPDTRAAIWNEGFDEAWEQADGEWIAGAFAGGIASAAFGLLVGCLAGRRGRS